MNLPLDFKEYILKGVVKKQHKDFSRAEFLIEESKKSYIGLNRILEKIGIDEFNSSDIIKSSYDIIMELIRAKLFIEGFSCSGFFAHEAEIAYMRELNFSEFEIIFMNELRYIRNGIIYYGKSRDKEYAEKVIKFLKEIFKRLIDCLDLN